MAIAVDATSGGYKSALDANSLTVAHTCTGSDLMLVVSLGLTFDRISGVTYNGVSMTQAVKKQDGGNNTNYIYYLASPATGTNNIVVTVTGSTRIRSANASYTGVDATIGGTATDGAGGASVSSLTTTINMTDAGAWHVGNCGFQRPPSAGTNATLRGTLRGDLGMFDSNGTVGATGNHSMSYTFSSVTIQQSSAMAINPAGGAAPAFIPKILQSS